MWPTKEMTSITALAAVKCNSQTFFIKNYGFWTSFVYMHDICTFSWCSLMAISQTAFLNKFKGHECIQLVITTFSLGYEHSISVRNLQQQQRRSIWSHGVVSPKPLIVKSTLIISFKLSVLNIKNTFLTLSCTNLISLVLPIHPVNGTHTQSMYQLSQGLEILL